MNKINFKKWFKRTKHSFKNIGSDADKDWRIMLILFVVLFLATILFHLNIFLEVQNISNSVDEIQMQRAQPVNATVLNQMIDKYDIREREYEKIASSTMVLVDPAR